MIYLVIWAIVTILSVIVGFTIGWFLIGRKRMERSAPTPLPADAEQLIQDAARRWAQARGRPMLAPLIAAKVRLAYRLHEDGRRSS